MTLAGFHFLAFAVLLGVASFLPPTASGVAASTQLQDRTRVIILGVDHSAQLVSEKDQPAVLAAFISALDPDAVCIERPPEQAARRDYYEFTYEVQGVVLPYVASHDVEVCPVDWMPPVEDQLLGFGVNLDDPLEVRREQGFQGFLTFSDPKTLTRDFFASDVPATTEPSRRWAAEAPPRADRDLPRRLYLYRTFMQAQRIRAAATTHRGGTVLVVIGEFHKPDIEAILSRDASINLVSPSTLPRPTSEAVEAATTQAQRAAILSFNLLGRQADTGNVNWPWINRVLQAFEAQNPSFEARLFRARFDQYTGSLQPRAAALLYRQIVADCPADVQFTWTGVKDASRIDSYFDPFGNLRVRQRAAIELARILYINNQDRLAARALADLRPSLQPRMASQLDGYLSYVRPRPVEPRPASVELN